MAKMVKKGLSGKTITINLFYDGDKYKDPVFVGINGMSWLVKRGEPVEVPVEVYDVLMNQMKQDKSAADLMKSLQKDSKEAMAEL